MEWKSRPVIRIDSIENILDNPVNVAKKLVELSKRSLDFIEDPQHALFKKSYRIEIVPVEHPRWEFQLHIHPKYWFDMIYYNEAKNEKEKKGAIKIAREYVNSIRSTYKPSIPYSS